MTGLVRSLVLEACAPGTSLFADKWRLEAVALPNNRGEPVRSAADRQRGELLSYFDTSEPELPERAIRAFAITPDEASFMPWPFGSTHNPRILKILDTSMDRERRLRGYAEPGWVTHAYDAAPHIVLCHPVVPAIDDRDWYEKAFHRLRARFAAEGSVSPLRTLVVAFTFYELSFVTNPQQAARHAQTSQVARARLLKAMNYYPPLKEGLRSLSAFQHLRVVGIPVSTYGFVRGDGRPNCDFLLAEREPFGGAPAARFLTRPDIYCPPLSAVRNPLGVAADPPNFRIDWLLRHWRPFLTADPFIACMSGDSHELVFDLHDLLEETRAHRFT
jgi:hypothetical protein